MERISTFLAKLSAIIIRFIERAGWRLVIGLTLSVTTLILFGWVASEVFKGELAVFDENIRQAYQSLAAPWLTGVMIFFTYLGSVYGIAALLVLAMLLMLRMDLKRAAALLTITMSGEAILGIVLKLSFQRPRPQAFFGFEPPASYSFPSGHAFASLCFFGALAWISTSQMTSRSRIAMIWVAAVFFILFIGSSRIYLGVHYPSDILAGYLAGIVWLSTVYLADHHLQAIKSKST